MSDSKRLKRRNAFKRVHSNEDEVLRCATESCVICTLIPYRSVGRHLDHRDVHLTNVGVQAPQLLESTAAVHARKQGCTF